MKSPTAIIAGAFSLAVMVGCIGEPIDGSDDTYVKEVEQDFGMVIEDPEPTPGWTFCHNPNAPAVSF